ncbi:MAG: hypothetical protein H6539_08890 [Bacteroidales bacterium]|nr:hypothetical protein [Bacteroidales bacterium]
MKRSLITLGILLQFLLLTAQVQTAAENSREGQNGTSLNPAESPEGNFIYTYSGNIFTGNYMDLTDEKGYTFIILDSLKVNTSQIKFLKYYNNFWANTRKLENTERSLFALRTYAGNLNLYTRLEVSESGNFNNVYISNDQLWADMTKNVDAREFKYYNKGYGDLKSLKYNNLVDDLSDNAECISLLNESRAYSNKSKKYYALGAAAIIYAFINGVSTHNENSFQSKSFGFSVYIPIGIGIGSFWLGSRISKRASDLLLKSVEIYK